MEGRRKNPSKVGKPMFSKDCQTSAIDIEGTALDTSIMHLEDSVVEDPQEDIYEYFKCYDAAVQMELEYADAAVGTELFCKFAETQTYHVHPADAAVQVDFELDRGSFLDIMTNVAVRAKGLQ